MNAIRIFFGSLVVYFIVAAAYGCSPTAHQSAATGAGGGRGLGGSASVHGGNGGIGGVATGGMSGKGGGGPVPDADANQDGSRLKAVKYVGLDGSIMYQDSMYDSQLDSYCSYMADASGIYRCVPNYIGTFTEFSDPACKVPVARRPDLSVCGQMLVPPKAITVVLSDPSTGCTSFKSFYVGSKFSGQLYTQSGSSCIQTVASQYYAYYAIGTEIPQVNLVSAMIGHD